MSYTVINLYSFSCDHPDCFETIECIPGRPRKPLGEAHGLIRLKGWAASGRRTARRHFCPAHIPEGVSLKKQLALHVPRETLTADNFMAHVDLTGSCWLWKERCNSEGYGTWGRRFAHRLSYELYVAPIPLDFTIDHLCFNPPCVRPDHLRAIPRRANDLRKREFGRAACPERQRVIGGRYLGGMDGKQDGKIKLLRHKKPDGLTYCDGAGTIMQAITEEENDQ